MKKIKIFGFSIKTRFLTKVICSCCIISVIIFSIVTLNINVELKAMAKNFTTSVNPYTVLFEDKGSIFYVSDFGVSKIINDTSMPTASIYLYENCKLENGEIHLKSNVTEIVKSVADGVVKNIGVKNGKKYIEIRHGNNIISKYYGIDIVGVVTNSIVSNNSCIATVKSNEELIITFEKDGHILNNFELDGNKVIWQNQN